MSLQGLVQSFSTIHLRKCSAQAAPKRAEGRKDAASPLDKGVTSYLCPLSLQTQEAQVHHEVPWGLLVLSGLWVLPCQDLLKMDMPASQLESHARAHGQLLHSRVIAQSLF